MIAARLKNKAIPVRDCRVRWNGIAVAISPVLIVLDAELDARFTLSIVNRATSAGQ